MCSFLASLCRFGQRTFDLVWLLQFHCHWSVVCSLFFECALAILLYFCRLLVCASRRTAFVNMVNHHSPNNSLSAGVVSATVSLSVFLDYLVWQIINRAAIMGYAKPILANSIAEVAARAIGNSLPAIILRVCVADATYRLLGHHLGVPRKFRPHLVEFFGACRIR